MKTFLKISTFFIAMVSHTLLFCDPLVVGICGASGSGKSEFAKEIVQRLGSEKVCMIQQDNYYKTITEYGESNPKDTNYDVPDAINAELLKEHIEKLKKECSINMPQYSFKTRTRTKYTNVDPKKILIVEGILIYAIPEIADLIDVKIYLDGDDDLLFIRQYERDSKERGLSYKEVKDKYIRFVKPAYHKYVEKNKEIADVVIPADKDTSVSLDVIEKYLSKEVEDRS